jgi:hypothetical protein
MRLATHRQRNNPHIPLKPKTDPFFSGLLDEAGVTFKYPGVMLENGTLASILAWNFD